MLLPLVLAWHQLTALSPRSAATPFLPPGEVCPLQADRVQEAFQPGFPAALAFSLDYLNTPAAAKAYEGKGTVSAARVRRTLERFRELIRTPLGPEALLQAIQAEFQFLPVAGQDGAGSMLFTGYFEAAFDASLKPDAEYRFPLYRRPPNLATWRRPHPSRVALEGPDGLRGPKGPLKGLELVWLKDRFETFLVQVQGSARLRLRDGSLMSVGYAGGTDHPYVSLGGLLRDSGKLQGEDLRLPNMMAFFKEHPEELGPYLSRCDRFIFFRDTHGAPPRGGLTLPVTTECTVATDKQLFPPGGLAFLELDMPFRQPDGTLVNRKTCRFVLDQDSGSAIQGPGRMDVFMGTGEEAGDRAGRMAAPGRAWYLLLKEPAGKKGPETKPLASETAKVPSTAGHTSALGSRS